MTIAELIQKIKAEIERLKAENERIKCASNSAYCTGYDDAFYDLLPFLDTLQEPEVEYIRKDALLEWLEYEKEWFGGTDIEPHYQKVINKLNSM